MYDVDEFRVILPFRVPESVLDNEQRSEEIQLTVI